MDMLSLSMYVCHCGNHRFYCLNQIANENWNSLVSIIHANIMFAMGIDDPEKSGSSFVL
jgi:hypothetical protein